MTPSLRIIFAGTPDFAAEHLAALLASHHQVIAAYTQPDRPAGRGKKLTPSPVKTLALTHDIVVYQPASLKSPEAQQELAALQADIMVVVAYGLILPQAVLDLPHLGCINVHGSILPRWRGAAPIQRAIWAGDAQTGVTIMQMDQGLDTGDMLHISALEIAEDETSASLYTRLAELGPQALLDCLALIAEGKTIKQPQDDAKATYAQKLSKQEAQIDWNLPAQQIERCVRAFNPWPVSYFNLTAEDGALQAIKVWQAAVLAPAPAFNLPQPAGTIVAADKNGISVATQEGVINLLQLQLPGKKAMSAADILNSRRDWFKVGSQLLHVE